MNNFFLQLFTTKGALNYLWKHGCHPMDPAINPFWAAVNMQTRYRYPFIMFMGKFNHGNYIILKLFSA